MANPNIVNVTSILGKTDTFALTTTLTALVTCATDKVYKINTILVSNIDGTNAQDVTLKVNNGSNDRAIASKNSTFYLEQGYVLKGQAGSNSDLECIVSYEILDDA